MDIALTSAFQRSTLPLKKLAKHANQNSSNVYFVTKVSAQNVSSDSFYMVDFVRVFALKIFKINLANVFWKMMRFGLIKNDLKFLKELIIRFNFK